MVPPPMHPSSRLPDLYPEAAAQRTWRLPVDGGHALQVREWGPVSGLPALVLHGGPGSGCSPLLARFFDSARYRVICMDQRGAGASQPAGCTLHNTTAHLLADLRRLREHLGLACWLVVGGSWGATLALLHALDDPAAVTGLLLRGVFLARRQDIAGFFDAAAWARWQPAGASLVEALDRVMQEGSEAEQAELVRHWWRWEQSMDAVASPGPVEPTLAPLLQRYRVQAHYLRQGCWLDGSMGLLDRLDRLVGLPNVPLRLLHGTQDRICPPAGALALQQRWPAAQLQWVDGAGHAPTHPAMVAAMRTSLDAWAANGSFGGT